MSDSQKTDYRAGVRDERARILELIPELMKAWGHNGQAGCACCVCARDIAHHIEKTRPSDDTRVVDGVIIRGPDA